MRVPLLLALLLPVLHAFAAEAPAKPDAPLAIQAVAPDLLTLEKDLTGKLEEKKNGTLTPEDYRKWEANFRARLAAVIERIAPSPDNQAAHARVMALLGERIGAAAALDQALDGNPGNPVLLRTKGRLLLEQKDYAGAAEHGRLAWEKSGKTDTDALALYQTAKDRVAPTGAGPPVPTVGSTPSNGSTVASSDDPSKPYKLPVKGSARPNEVPAFSADPAPDAPAPSNGAGLLTMLGVGVGVLLIAWGAMPAETKERLKQDLWGRPRQEMKALAAVTAVGIVAYGGWLFLSSILGAGAPAGAALTPALVEGGTAGGGIVLQQAAVGTAKAAILTGGAYVVGRRTLDQVSYTRSESGSPREDASTQSSGSSNPDPEKNPRSNIKKPSAQNKELQRVIDKLFKESDTKPGGTARAARDEFASGQPTKGKWHNTPAKERLTWLRRVMRDQKLDPIDKATAEALEADLQSAINLYKITP